MADSYRYKAFISYAHEDEAFAASLHRRLERFVVPKQLRRVNSTRRLGTIFRDRDELASGGRLSTSIVSAIEEAQFLIVVCSDASARSEWVGREIAAFLRVRSLDQVLLIVPNDAPAGDLSFPAALGDENELLAADARPSGDGAPAAFSKLVAGLLQVPLDTLVQRERQRRRRQVLVAAGGAAALTVAAATSMYLVRSAANEADARRQQAASFAGFFVDSLNERITRYEKVGTLDSDLTKALEFFATLQPDDMDPKTLNDYRTALIGIGNVRIRQGKPQAALEVYARASELSRSMVAREGNEARHWHNLAMLTYYIGEAHWEMQDFPETAKRIVEALEYAERAASLAPDEFEYRIEVVFELTNLGATNTRLKRYDAAVEALQRSIDEIARLRASMSGHEQDLLEQEVEAISWLGEIAQKRSQYQEAFEWHEREIRLREQLIAATHDNPHHIARLGDALGYYADSLTAVGDTKRAVEILKRRVEVSNRAAITDPENAFYRERVLIGQAMLSNALFEGGDAPDAAKMLDTAERGMQAMIAGDMQAEAVKHDLIYVAATRAYQVLHTDPNRAFEIANAAADQAMGLLDRDHVNSILLFYYLRCAAVLAAAQQLSGKSSPAQIHNALSLVIAHGSSESTADLAYQAILLSAVGRRDEALPLKQRLESVGYQPVFYRSMLDVLEQSRV